MTSRIPDIEMHAPFLSFRLPSAFSVPIVHFSLCSHFSFSFKIVCIVDMDRPNDSEISLTVVLPSSFAAWRISSIMTSPISVGLPGLSSSSIDARPFRNLLCHINTIDMETCTSSTVISIIYLVSVDHFPRLTQTLITALCSNCDFCFNFRRH